MIAGALAFLAMIASISENCAVQVKGKSVNADEGTTATSKPRLIVHVGPKKTASTALQCSLTMNAGLLASSSPYRYVGRSVSESYCPLIRGIHGPNENIHIAKLHTELVRHLEQGHSPIHSSETLTDSYIQGWSVDDIEMLQHMKMDEGWPISFVVTYRRYYEWLPSYWYQQLHVNLQTRGRSFAEVAEELSCYISPMQSFIDTRQNCSIFKGYSLHAHPSMQVSEAIRNALGADDVVMLNLYEVDHEPEKKEHDLLAMFARTALPGSEEFQKRFSAGEGVPTPYIHEESEETKTLMAFHQLALMAYAEGLITARSATNEVLSNAENVGCGNLHLVAKMLKEHHKEIQNLLGGDMPSACLSQEQMTKLLESSLSFERSMFPDWSDKDLVESEHRVGFQKYMTDGKFCHWDFKEIMTNPEVRHLIEDAVRDAFECIDIEGSSLIVHRRAEADLFDYHYYFYYNHHQS